MASSLPITQLKANLRCSNQLNRGARRESGSAVVNPKNNVTRRLYSLCREGTIQEASVSFNEMEMRNVRMGPEVYGELLQACTNKRDRSTGRQVHARIIKNGWMYSGDEYIDTKVLIFYAKCDVPDDADTMFRRMAARNEFAWAAMIGMYCEEGRFAKALIGHNEMLEDGIFADNFVLPNVLKACGSLMLIQYGKAVHGYVLKMGFGQCLYVASSLVDMYGKCGALEDARKLFDGMDERNAVVWNCMIVGYVRNGNEQEALRMFYEMRIEDVEPTRVTVSSFLSAAAVLGAVKEGKQGHAVALSRGLELDDILGTSMINFYLKCGLIEDAEQIFKRMMVKDTVTWNLMVSECIRHGLGETAIDMCRRMSSENLRYDSVTLDSILSAAAKKDDLKLGKEAHCYCIRNNLESDPVVASSIIVMYASCDRIGSARQVFENASQIDLIMWNTLMSSYAKLGMSDEASRLFQRMLMVKVEPDVVSWNSLIHGLFNNKKVDAAWESFSQMEHHGIWPNHLTWTTLVSGFGKNSLYDKAIQTFIRMQDSGVKPNVVSIVSAMSSCRGSDSLRYGRTIHGYVLRHALDEIPEVATSIIDMYAKAGRAEEAQKYFDTAMKKDMAVYNTMISCNAVHGRGHEALKLYERLRLDGFQPDCATFTGILTACSHSGLVDEAMAVMYEMTDQYHIKPSIEHYGCIVSLLCRSGHLQEALRIVLGMPYEPDAHTLGSLVTACRETGEVELGESLSERVMGLDPGNVGNLVALSNVYAAVERWDRVSETREAMRVKGLRKRPGCSWIKIGEASHIFVAGDKSHPDSSGVHRMMKLLEVEMRSTDSSNA
ncbi:hypothetical protein MLD38_006846 [Melastoma candidum]|uniref:Uncharacterized protein n=1 Tax=Melastoma candidum TaxID=119954 RepID=A0ACB9RNW4_9MYRT|nr:hypothetical protein MLD38_006846 [Melastoma candidum]